jgi:hypothetical protein
MFNIAAAEEDKQFRVGVATWCLVERLWKIYNSAIEIVFQPCAVAQGLS